jgi:hypothetical protein
MENNSPHWLDSLVWDPETWVTEFNNLLDAFELQFAVESELSAEIDALGDYETGEDL